MCFPNLFEALKALLHMGSTTDIKTEIKSASLIPFQLLRKENHTFICHVLQGATKMILEKLGRRNDGYKNNILL